MCCVSSIRQILGGQFASSDRISTFGTSVFTEFTALCLKHKAVNLGQGFPGTLVYIHCLLFGICTAGFYVNLIVVLLTFV